MLLAVVPSDGDSFKAYVVCINFARWELELRCDGENAAASANIGNGVLGGLDQLQQEGDHLLCLGPAAGKELFCLHVLLVQECAIAVGMEPVSRPLQYMA